MKLFGRLILVTMVATYLLIFVGSLVRVSGAGLGCPDWPMCFGNWHPPFTQAELNAAIASGAVGAAPMHSKDGLDLDPSAFNVTLAWIEYLNRLLGVVLGMLVLAVVVTALAVRDVRQNRPALFAALLSLPLVILNGGLGALVVKSGLNPGLVTVHMGLALFMASVLVYGTLRGFRAFESPTVGNGTPPKAAPPTGLAKLVLGAWALTIVQICLGADMRGQIDVLVARLPGLESTSILQTLGAIKHFHMITGLIVAAVSYGLALRIQRRRFEVRPAAVVLARLLMFLTLAQVVLGFCFGTIGLLPLLKIFHLWTASVIVGLWVVLYIALRRPAPVPSADDLDLPETHHVGRVVVRWLAAGALFLAIMSVVGIVTVRRAEAAKGGPLPVFGRVAPFSFPSTSGVDYGREELNGKVTVLNFMFTSCPSVCPIMTPRVAGLHAYFADKPEVQFISITVDPEVDTLDVMRNYGSNFGSDTRWHWVRGSIPETQALAESCGTRSDFPNHSTKLILVDALGRIRGYYDSMVPEPAERLKHDISELLKVDPALTH